MPLAPNFGRPDPIFAKLSHDALGLGNFPLRGHLDRMKADAESRKALMGRFSGRSWPEWRGIHLPPRRDDLARQTAANTGQTAKLLGEAVELLRKLDRE